MTPSDTLICKTTGCWFELPPDAFPLDHRNIKRHGRATRCHACEAARDRKPGKVARPGSKAAEVEALKASGLYTQHDSAQWEATRANSAPQRELDRQKNKDRARAARFYQARFDRWTAECREALTEFATPPYYAMQKLEEVCATMGAEVPDDLRPFVGNWRPRAAERTAARDRLRAWREKLEANRLARLAAKYPV